MKKIICLVLSFITVFALTSCSGSSTNTNTAVVETNEDGYYILEDYKYEFSDEKTNYVLITMSDGQRMLLELYPDIAPETVENFQNLVYTKFYDGIIFHRVIKDFMIQGGDPDGTGYGGSETKIKGEFSANGFENNLSHDRGVISMARQGGTAYNSATSQFFIVHSTKYKSSLDGLYASFGKLLAGYSTLDNIANVETNAKDKPTTEQKMETVRFVILK